MRQSFSACLACDKFMRIRVRSPTKQAALPLSSKSSHRLQLSQMSATTLLRLKRHPSSHQSYQRDPWRSGTLVPLSEPSHNNLSRGGRKLQSSVTPPCSRQTKVNLNL